MPRVAHHGPLRLDPAEPEWQGFWHLTTGDVHYRTHSVMDDSSVSVIDLWTSVRCGKRVTIQSVDVFRDVCSASATTAEAPTMDTCSRCLRYGPAQPVAIPEPTPAEA